MRRDAFSALNEWKSSSRRKPLILRGPRQVGKTHLLKAFARSAYKDLAYFNFEEDPLLGSLFERDLDPHRIVKELGLRIGRELKPTHDLIVFDEVQISDKALTSLKYFQEKASSFHLIAAGSHIGIKLSKPGSFPVGKVNFLEIHPMSFLEYLDAMGDGPYRRHLEELHAFEPLSEAMHQHLIDRLREYYIVGGMPEAVAQYAESGNLRDAREIQGEIVQSYELDFAKHAPRTDLARLTRTWQSIPKHLARENKKFLFSLVRKGARAREYESALTWLHDTGLIHRSTCVKRSQPPLSHYADPSCFKVFALDVGLLGFMARTSVTITLEGERLFTEYRGALVENYVAQQLVATTGQALHYWRSKGGKAELDFLLEEGDEILPLEAKAGVNPRSKSLRSYDDQYSPTKLLRTTLLNLKADGKIFNCPLYAVGVLPRLLAQCTGNP